MKPYELRTTDYEKLLCPNAPCAQCPKNIYGKNYCGFEIDVAHAAQKKLVSDMNSKCPHFPELHLRKWGCGECRFEYLKDFEIGE